MLVIKIELHSANTGQVTELGRMLIANEGGDAKLGDYSVHVLRRGSIKVAPRLSEYLGPLGAVKFKGTQRWGEVKNYPRLSYNVWRLVSRALRSAFPEEK